MADTAVAGIRPSPRPASTLFLVPFHQVQAGPCGICGLFQDLVFHDTAALFQFGHCCLAACVDAQHALLHAGLAHPAILKAAA